MPVAAFANPAHQMQADAFALIADIIAGTGHQVVFDNQSVGFKPDSHLPLGGVFERIADQVGYDNHQGGRRCNDLAALIVGTEFTCQVLAVCQIGKIDDGFAHESRIVDLFPNTVWRCFASQLKQGFNQLLHVAVGAFDARGQPDLNFV